MLQQQLAATGQAVANLTLEQMRSSDVQDSPRPPLGGASRQGFHRGQHSGGFVASRSSAGQGSQDQRGGSRAHLPKMSFPRFSGQNPKIWKDKCMDYFTIFGLPE